MSSCSTPATAAGSLRATSGRSPCRSTSPSSSSAPIRTSWNSARPTAERRHAARQRSTLDPLPCKLQWRFYSFQTQAYSLLTRDFGPAPLPLCPFRWGGALGGRLAWLWRRQDASDGALEYLARLFDAQLAGGFDEACRLLGIVHLWGRGLGLVVRAAGHGSQDAAL